MVSWIFLTNIIKRVVIHLNAFILYNECYNRWSKIFYDALDSQYYSTKKNYSQNTKFSKKWTNLRVHVNYNMITFYSGLCDNNKQSLAVRHTTVGRSCASVACYSRQYSVKDMTWVAISY